MSFFGNLFRARAGAPETTILYTGDVHGCDMAWRKFLATPSAYGASVLILGGDITGKAMVPIIARPEGGWFRYDGAGKTEEIASAEELEEVQENLIINGFYPLVCDEDEHARLSSDDEYREEVFDRLIVDRVEDWVRLADMRLADWDGSIWVMPGNDDHFTIDAKLDGKVVKNPAGRVVDVNGYPMVSLDWVNPTPWDTPREESEEDLARRIDALVEGVAMEKAIFNFHAPPYNTSLDVGPTVNADLSVEKEAGGVKPAAIGSRAVRDAIEKYQPLLSLHGHVHESAGIEKIGRTTSVNPGSRYNEGVLDGALIKLRDAEVRSCQLVSG